MDYSTYPALYQSADHAAADGQRRYLSGLRLRLSALIVAAIGGAASWQAGGIDLWGVAAGLAFLIAIGVEFKALVDKPERKWFLGRFVAESTKSLAWRYVAGGDPFAIGGEDDQDSAFLDEIKPLYPLMDQMEASPPREARYQITPKMRELRAKALPDRRTSYSTGRIADQYRWYTEKTEWHTIRARRAVTTALALQGFGVVSAVLKAFAIVSIDLLGIVAATAAAFTALSQARQHQVRRDAYAVAAQELAAIASALDSVVTEASWADFVGSAEDAISREHVAWSVSHGQLPPAANT